MAIISRKKRWNREVILRATIEYGYESRKGGRRLNPQSDSPYEKFQQESKKIIEDHLPDELLRIYGIKVKTRVIDTQRGSLLIFFSAVFTGVSILSSYADFFASIKLIKEHAKLLLERMTGEYRNDDFDVSVSDQFPTLDDPNDAWPRRRFEKMFGPGGEEFFENYFLGAPRQRRDAFFWFLLILNILLLGAIGFLVAKAVEKTYFS